MSNDLLAQAIELVAKGEKLGATKLLRQTLHSGLKDTYEFVEAIEEDLKKRFIPSAEILNQFEALTDDGKLQQLLKERYEQQRLAGEYARLAREAEAKIGELQLQITELASRR